MAELQTVKAFKIPFLFVRVPECLLLSGKLGDLLKKQKDSRRPGGSKLKVPPLPGFMSGRRHLLQIKFFPIFLTSCFLSSLYCQPSNESIQFFKRQKQYEKERYFLSNHTVSVSSQIKSIFIYIAPNHCNISVKGFLVAGGRKCLIILTLVLKAVNGLLSACSVA